MCAAYYANDYIRSFFVSVYTWMSVALGVTASTAAYIAYYNPELLLTILQSSWLFFGLIVVQLGLVMWLSMGIMRMSFYQALAILLLYSMANGVMFSVILFTYTAESVVTTFAVTAAMFGGMALFGRFTSVNISASNSFFIMLLWGLIVSMLVNLYFQNSTMDLIISAVGVLVFAALTAIDTQKLTRIAQEWEGDRDALYQVALWGALTLYLDFINLFLMLLRFTGSRNRKLVLMFLLGGFGLVCARAPSAPQEPVAPVEQAEEQSDEPQQEEKEESGKDSNARIEEKSKISQDVVTKAIAFIEKEGIPAACYAFQNDPVWSHGEIFPWIFDANGTCYVYGQNREMLWKNFSEAGADRKLVPFVKQMVEAGKTGGFVNFFLNNGYCRAYVKTITIGKKQFIIGAGQFPISPVYIVDELINSAIAYMKKTSLNELIERINNPTGVFVRGGINLKLYKPDGTCVADGEQLAFVGQNLIDATTADGKFLVRDIIKIAMKDGQGWYDFVGQSGGEPARTFARKIMDPETNTPYILSSGYYTQITDETVIGLVKKAVNFLRANGREIAFREFSTQNDKFVKGNVNIFVYDMQGTMVADSANPAFVGLNLMNTRDSDGKFITKQVLETADKYGKGWVTNFLRNSYQVSYVEKVQVPDGDFVIGAAYFPVSKENYVRFMVDDAILSLKNGPFEKTLRKFVTDGPDFVRGDLRIFAYTEKGICLADGLNLTKIWTNDSDAKDQNGVKIIEKIIALGSTGGGWAEFKLNNAPCRVFVKGIDLSKQKARTQMVIVGSAYYP